MSESFFFFFFTLSTGSWTKKKGFLKIPIHLWARPYLHMKAKGLEIRCDLKNKKNKNQNVASYGSCLQNLLGNAKRPSALQDQRSDSKSQRVDKLSFVPFPGPKGHGGGGVRVGEGRWGQDVGGAAAEECPVGTTSPSDVQDGTEDQTWSGKLALNSD